jgi:hypothetical protein
MSNRPLLLLAISISGAMLFACGGSGSGSSSTTAGSTTSNSVTYLSSSPAGEVIQYAIDTVAKTYTYKILVSSYGLTGKSASGTLLARTASGGWNASPSTDNVIQSAIFQIGVDNSLSGLATINFGQGPVATPIIGQANVLTAIPDDGVIVNQINIGCSSKSYGTIYGNSNCGRGYGSLYIGSDGYTLSCWDVGLNTSTTPPTCLPGGAGVSSGTTTADQNNPGLFITSLSCWARGSATPTCPAAFNITAAPSGAYILKSDKKGSYMMIGDLTSDILGIYGQIFGASGNPVGNIDGSYVGYATDGAVESFSIAGSTMNWGGNVLTILKDTDGFNPIPGMIAWTLPSGEKRAAIIGYDGTFVSAITRPYSGLRLATFYQVGVKQ